jgi:hypothetical protein
MSPQSQKTGCEACGKDNHEDSANAFVLYAISRYIRLAYNSNAFGQERRKLLLHFIIHFAFLRFSFCHSFYFLPLGDIEMKMALLFFT